MGDHRHVVIYCHKCRVYLRMPRSEFDAQVRSMPRHAPCGSTFGIAFDGDNWEPGTNYHYLNKEDIWWIQ